MKKLVVVVDPGSRGRLDAVATHTSDQYLAGENGTLEDGLTVVNLCRSYQYLTKGYYVSLLADAREQEVYPTLEMVEDITSPFAYFQSLRAAGIATIDFKVLRERRRLFPKVIVPQEEGGGSAGGQPMILPAEGENGARYEKGTAGYVEAVSVFGKTSEDRFRRHCAAVFRVYAFPLLRIRMYQEEDEWRVGQIAPLSPAQLSEEDLDRLVDQIRARAWEGATLRAPDVVPQRIACLWEEDDPLQPSDEKTLNKFMRAAQRQGTLFEIIGKNDLARLSHYDALFIRTVTAIDHYSFRFAQTAASLGMPVIDDPQSTMKCSNKVYLYELFARNGIPTPQTRILSRKTPISEIAALGFPLILKVPDGAFSQSVKKAADADALEALMSELLRETPLLVAQEFRPTAFDWRVTVLDKKVLFACRYHMAKRHWQIARTFDSGFTRFGKVEAVAVQAVPLAVQDVAIESASLIGDGLYGVDLKETDSGVVVIEINDNPNIEAGFEDAVEGDRIYDEIVGWFLRRIHEAARI